MKKLSLVLGILLLISFAVIGILILKNRINKIDYLNELETVEGTYTDKLGRQVRYTQAVETKLSEMKAASDKDSAQLSNYQNRLAWAYTEIKALNGKLKNLKEFTIVGTSISGEFTEPLKDTIINEKKSKTAFYSNGYLDEMIIIPEALDSATVYYWHSDTLILPNYWIRKPNKKGKQVFFLWRWLRPWEIHIEAKSMDPNGEINLLDKVITKNK